MFKNSNCIDLIILFRYSESFSLTPSNGLGVALRSPLFITIGLIPIFFSSSVISAVWRITPIDPVIVPMLLNIFCEAKDTKYPPDVAISLI